MYRPQKHIRLTTGIWRNVAGGEFINSESAMWCQSSISMVLANNRCEVFSKVSHKNLVMYKPRYIKRSCPEPIFPLSSKPDLHLEDDNVFWHHTTLTSNQALSSTSKLVRFHQPTPPVYNHFPFVSCANWPKPLTLLGLTRLVTTASNYNSHHAVPRPG